MLSAYYKSRVDAAVDALRSDVALAVSQLPETADPSTVQQAVAAVLRTVLYPRTRPALRSPYNTRSRTGDSDVLALYTVPLAAMCAQLVPVVQSSWIAEVTHRAKAYGSARDSAHSRDFVDACHAVHTVSCAAAACLNASTPLPAVEDLIATHQCASPVAAYYAHAVLDAMRTCPSGVVLHA